MCPACGNKYDQQSRPFASYPGIYFLFGTSYRSTRAHFFFTGESFIMTWWGRVPNDAHDNPPPPSCSSCLMTSGDQRHMQATRILMLFSGPTSAGWRSCECACIAHSLTVLQPAGSASLLMFTQYSCCRSWTLIVASEHPFQTRRRRRKTGASYSPEGQPNGRSLGKCYM